MEKKIDCTFDLEEKEQQQLIKLWKDCGSVILKEEPNFAVVFALGESLIRLALQSMQDGTSEVSEADNIFIINRLQEKLIAFVKGIK